MPDTTERRADGRRPRRYRWRWFVGLYVAGLLAVAVLGYALKFLMHWVIGVQT